MARKVKTKYIGARMDDEAVELVSEYVRLAEEIESAGDLLRKAVLEYIANHPLPEVK